MSATATIPEELMALPQWVRWKLEYRLDRNGEKKATKVPYCAFGRKASTSDPSTWLRYEDARAALAWADGIGYVVAAEDLFTGVDLDDAVDEHDEIKPWAREIVEQLGSYTELSPSRKGLRIFVRAELRAPRNRVDVNVDGEKVGVFEVYDRARFFTVTGEVIGERHMIEERQPELDAVVERMFPATGPRPVPTAPNGSGLATDDDQELLERAFSAKNGHELEALYHGELSGYASPSEAIASLLWRLAFWTGPHPDRLDRLFRSSALMSEKWDERRGDSTWGARETEAAIASRTRILRAPAHRPAERPSKAAKRPAETEDEREEEARKQPERESDEHGDPPPYTDTGNAERFAAAHAHHLRYLRGRRHWLVWEDGRWRPDTTGEAERAAKDVAKSLLGEAAQLEGEESKKAAQWGLQSQSEPRLRAQLTLVGTEPEIVVSAGQLDADSYLLACGNGVLDLRAGKLREPRPDDLISLGTDVPYEPAAPCNRWLQFLDEVFAGDEELTAFFKRLVGYMLTGDTREHVLAVFHGAGCNGKSTLIVILRRLLGDHAVAAAFDTFMRRRDRGPRNDLARLTERGLSPPPSPVRGAGSTRPP